jgi:hypothetical protein
MEADSEAELESAETTSEVADAKEMKDSSSSAETPVRIEEPPAPEVRTESTLEISGPLTPSTLSSLLAHDSSVATLEDASTSVAASSKQDLASSAASSAETATVADEIGVDAAIAAASAAASLPRPSSRPSSQWTRIASTSGALTFFPSSSPRRSLVKDRASSGSSRRSSTHASEILMQSSRSRSPSPPLVTATAAASTSTDHSPLHSRRMSALKGSRPASRDGLSVSFA